MCSISISAAVGSWIIRFILISVSSQIVLEKCNNLSPAQMEISRGVWCLQSSKVFQYSFILFCLREPVIWVVIYLITDSIQQIHKISFLVYYLDLNQLFISLASSFQYVLIYARVFFMLQAKFSLKYKTALASGLNNSLQNLKFQTIFAFSSELKT